MEAIVNTEVVVQSLHPPSTAFQAPPPSLALLSPRKKPPPTLPTLRSSSMQTSIVSWG